MKVESDGHEQYLEAIDLATDGALDARRRSELDEHLAGCADCRAELAHSEAVAARLGSARVAVRPGFAREVMAAIEPAPWEARAPRVWALPVALLLVVGGAAAVLFGDGAAAFTGSGGTGGALIAVADLLRASLLAGSGLAAASWRAVGAAAGSWLGDSPGNWLAAIVLVAGANYLLFRLLRLRRATAESVALDSGAPRRK